MSSPRLVAVIGATGAQGIPVVRDLLKSGDYSIRVLTRDTNSARFKELQAFGPIESVVGTFASEESLRATFRGAWGAFVNIDGFNSGEKNEIFWTIRGKIFSLFCRIPTLGAEATIGAWELALEEGVQFYVHGNLDYAWKKGGFRREFYCGHYDGKGRVAEWMLKTQNQDPAVHSRMRTAALTTGPYIEMTIAHGTPFPAAVEDGIATWHVPLGANGAVPFVALDDVGVYAKYLFDNFDGAADGLDLEVAIEHVTFEEYARAFTRVTGQPAQWIDGDVDAHLTAIWGAGAERPAGYNADAKDAGTLTLRQNFTAFFNLWRASGGNKGVIRRDYGMLDRIFPGRIKSVEEWMRRENEKGLEAGLGSLWDRIQPQNMRHILKITEDGRKGTI
ncbi:hypothetical protein F4777DRAFT_575603 [Nemania sp. FL0916]|nr:hypothetical protein F4777DRAFT_575603 [Nemania sp. FL0916]